MRYLLSYAPAPVLKITGWTRAGAGPGRPLAARRIPTGALSVSGESNLELIVANASEIFAPMQSRFHMMSPAKRTNNGKLEPTMLCAFYLLSTQNAIFGLKGHHTMLQHLLKRILIFFDFFRPPSSFLVKTLVIFEIWSQKISKKSSKIIFFQNFRIFQNFKNHFSWYRSCDA